MIHTLYLILGLIALTFQDSAKKVTSSIKSPKTGDYITLSTKIDSLNLATMPTSDLRLLRNEVFARRGYLFTSKDLTEYFMKFNWYKPQFAIKEVVDKLTKVDLYNVALIKSIEAVNQQEFQRYLRLIPSIELPISFTCGDAFDAGQVDQENYLIKKYKQKEATIIGKLFQNESEVAVIYAYPSDVFYPIVSVTDSYGNELRTIRFFKLIHCTGGEGYVASTKGIMTKDFKIKTTTEIITWDTEKEGAEKKTEIIKNEVKIK